MKAITRINKLNQTLELLNMNGYTTTAPVFPGNCADLMPEFGRFQVRCFLQTKSGSTIGQYLRTETTLPITRQINKEPENYAKT